METKDYAAALDAAEKSLAQKERGKPLEPKHTDSDTIYFVGRLNSIANASQREDGSDIPLGETLREAVQHMEHLADANGAVLEALKEAIAGYEECSQYKGDYLREKHGDDEEIAALKAVVAKAEGRS